ncbi:diol dehydratase small subunit [Saccharopolyspora sp. NPDC050642]|uniref:diol dehydratase small subunit n=1 Tax=Saccharopolyspora sp. NPDC050642 TaxID=3157099 RepID=UPI0033CB716E
MNRTGTHVPTVSRYDYPLSTERPELLRTKSEKAFTDITLAKMREGGLVNNDLRIHPQSLLLQAQIAKDAGRPELADNLRRAAELTQFDDEKKILEFYDAMRPSLANREQMTKVAAELEEKDAPLCAQLVREAIEVYEERNLFQHQDGAGQHPTSTDEDQP